MIFIAYGTDNNRSVVIWSENWKRQFGRSKHRREHYIMRDLKEPRVWCGFVWHGTASSGRLFWSNKFLVLQRVVKFSDWLTDDLHLKVDSGPVSYLCTIWLDTHTPKMSASSLSATISCKGWLQHVLVMQPGNVILLGERFWRSSSFWELKRNTLKEAE